MGNIEYNTLVEQFEQLKDRVYNLNLYLTDIEAHHPEIIADVGARFSGMPGYVGDAFPLPFE